MATPVPDNKQLLRYNMAVDVVRYVGEPVAAVVAKTPYEVEDALELVEVDYESLDPIVSIGDALRESLNKSPEHALER